MNKKNIFVTLLMWRKMNKKKGNSDGCTVYESNNTWPIPSYEENWTLDECEYPLPTWQVQVENCHCSYCGHKLKLCVPHSTSSIPCRLGCEFCKNDVQERASTHFVHALSSEQHEASVFSAGLKVARC